MHRAFRGVLVSAGLPVAVATVVLVIGTALARPAPEAPPARWWPSFGCFGAPLLAAGGSSVTGAALLCVTDDGVRPSLTARGLPPGGAYSVWLQSANHPATCHSELCTSDEIFAPSRT